MNREPHTGRDALLRVPDFKAERQLGPTRFMGRERLLVRKPARLVAQAILVSIVCVQTFSAAVCAREVEEKQTIQKTFRFDEGSATRQVDVDNFEVSIRVSGYDGREVQLTVIQTLEADSQEKAQAARRDVRLDITQSNNTVRCYVDGPFRCKNGSVDFRGWKQLGYRAQFDFELKVPQQTALRLKTVNGRDIEVEKTSGKFEVENINGGVRMTDIAGAGRVYTLNGKVLPAETKATVKMETQIGSIYSDFEIQMSAGPRPPTVEDGRKGGGRYRVAIEKARFGSINSGGPEFHFKTVNGGIHIRKGK